MSYFNQENEVGAILSLIERHAPFYANMPGAFGNSAEYGYSRVSADEDAAIAAEFRGGATITAIAKQHNRARQTIREHLQRLGLHA